MSKKANNGDNKTNGNGNDSLNEINNSIRETCRALKLVYDREEIASRKLQVRELEIQVEIQEATDESGKKQFGNEERRKLEYLLRREKDKQWLDLKKALTEVRDEKWTLIQDLEFYRNRLQIRKVEEMQAVLRATISGAISSMF